MTRVSTDLEQFILSALASDMKSGVRVVGGPAVAVHTSASAVLAPVLNEVLGELHGFSGAEPRVAIAWSWDGQGGCVIELGAGERDASAARSIGNGTVADVQAAALERAGEGMVHCELSRTGARITVPARYLAETSTADIRPAAAIAVGDPLVGRSVLVVEDQLIIALDLEMLLREQGAAEVYLCGSTEEAFKCLAGERPDVAVLDVNLGSSTSFPVARELQRLGVPFIFATGYGREVEFPRELRTIPLIGKPYCVDTMRKALLTSCMAHA